MRFKNYITILLFSVFTLNLIAQEDTLTTPKVTLNIPITSLVYPLFQCVPIGISYYETNEISYDFDLLIGVSKWNDDHAVPNRSIPDFSLTGSIRRKFFYSSYYSATSGIIFTQSNRKHVYGVEYQGVPDAFNYQADEKITRIIIPFLANIGAVDEMNRGAKIGLDFNLGAGLYFVHTNILMDNPLDYTISSQERRPFFSDPNQKIWPYAKMRIAFKFPLIK